jgi:hypothetical protein
MGRVGFTIFEAVLLPDWRKYPKKNWKKFGYRISLSEKFIHR